MTAPTLEEAIVHLQSFWRNEGCLLWQPLNTEVGAGTMNPATFLRALGSDPWKVAYVEPSVRPDDSRYGKNPNRIQTHTQFQVLLKPDTGRPVEQYIRSLEVLGVDTAGNDIRFVEDNWESPALGAWGLGWEVWLNGLEITQFTYFQQAGGLTLEPPSVEITYGLERILMALQHKTHFKEIRYSDRYGYGELFGRSEFEMSSYYLDAADVGRSRELFRLHEAEAQDMLERGLVVPAYLQVLRMSHLFNVLDARGAVGLAERAAFFTRMRNLSRMCAKLWVGEADASEEEEAVAEPPSAPRPQGSWAPAAPACSLLVELGVEEMPPGDIEVAVAHLEAEVPALLREARLSHGAIGIDASPRRLVVRAADVATRQQDIESKIKGPSASAAFAPDGTPTRAAVGFANRHGLTVETLERQEDGGREFVFARVKQEGRLADEVLGELLPALFAGIRFDRAMRWNESGVAFSRPVRWLVALLGDRLIACTFAGVASGTSSGALRGIMAPIAITHADGYTGALEQAGVMVSRSERRRRIWDEATAEAERAGAGIAGRYRDSLLPEVADLVESPTVLRGSFDERFLRLPAEVLATVMVKHQRCFPINLGAALRPEFVFVANGPVAVDEVRAGNEAVIRARYADAEFFYDQDLKQPFGVLRARLGTLTVHEKLGSMREKAERIEQLTRSLSELTGLSSDDAATAQRAAHLCKNDLASSLVTELPSLAGVMGRHYAEAWNESEAVAAAIEDHVRPVSAGDQPPAGLPGAIVGLADRLDSLVGLLAVGVKPRSTADPYGLRRAAYGVVQILRRHGVELDLRKAVDATAAVQPVPVTNETRDGVLDFAWRRLEVYLRQQGFAYDVVNAAIGGRRPSIVTKIKATSDLAKLVSTGRFRRAHAAWQRAANLASRSDGCGDPDPALFIEPAEHALWAALAPRRREVQAVGDFVDAFEPLADRIDRLFDDLLIISDDVALTRNRLALLAIVAGLPADVADLSALSTSMDLSATSEPVTGSSAA